MHLCLIFTNSPVDIIARSQTIVQRIYASASQTVLLTSCKMSNHSSMHLCLIFTNSPVDIIARCQTIVQCIYASSSQTVPVDIIARCQTIVQCIYASSSQTVLLTYCKMSNHSSMHLCLIFTNSPVDILQDVEP